MPRVPSQHRLRRVAVCRTVGRRLSSGSPLLLSFVFFLFFLLPATPPPSWSPTRMDLSRTALDCLSLFLPRSRIAGSSLKHITLGLSNGWDSLTMLSECFPYIRITIFITSTRTEMFAGKKLQRVLSRHLLNAAALCWFVFKVICLPQPLFPSLPLPLTAVKVPSSGIRNFADTIVKQMASAHPPTLVYELSTFLRVLSLFLSLSLSLTRSFTDIVCGLPLCNLFLSLAVFPSLFQSSSDRLSCILPHSPFPFIPRAWWSRKSCSVLTRTSTSLPPPVSEPGPYVSPKTDGNFVTRIRSRHVASSEIHQQKHASLPQARRVPVLSKCERVRSRVTNPRYCERVPAVNSRIIRSEVCSKAEMGLRKNWFSERNLSAVWIFRISRIRKCSPLLSQYFRKFPINTIKFWWKDENTR